MTDGSAAPVDPLHELAGHVAALAERLAAVEAQLADALNSGPAGPGKAGPYVWTELDDDEQAARLVELDRFADLLNRRYSTAGATVVPSCWAEHPPLVDELAALHAAWLAAYHRPERATAGPAGWLERTLPGFRTRIRTGGWHDPSCPGARLGPAGWTDLSAETAAALWAALAEFVDWLNRRYELGAVNGVPACWFRHPGLVEELTALRGGWLAAYTRTDVADPAPAGWHRDQLRPFLTRLANRELVRCGLTHQDGFPAPAPDRDGLHGHIADDRTARSASPAGAATC